jgi:DNA-directed RNA polymerase subunit RPC12/RpoP
MSTSLYECRMPNCQYCGERVREGQYVRCPYCGDVFCEWCYEDQNQELRGEK